jgi:SPP1 family phage portal protein
MLSETAFQSWITDAERHQRLDDYELYDRYYYGQFDQIELPKHIADCLDNTDVAMWANISRPIVDVAVQYICGASIDITVNGSGFDIKEAEDRLYQVYDNNGLRYRNMLKAIRIMCKKGDAFLAISKTDDIPKKWYKKVLSKIAFWRDYESEYWNKIKVRVLNPAFVFPKYANDDYEELEMVAIKYFEFDDAGDKIWHAKAVYPDVIQYWELASNNNDSEADQQEHVWELESTEPNPYGFIPIVHITNTIDDREYGVSDLHDVTKIQNMLLKTLTDLMISMDYQAFQRTYVLGAMSQRGSRIDQSPGNVVEIPNPEAKVLFVPNADMSPFLDVIKTLKQLGCEVSGTPQIALGTIEGGIPSGYALRIHYQPLENKCNEKKAMIQDAFQELNWMIFAIASIDGQSDYSTATTKLQFVGGLPVDSSDMVDKHEKQLGMGTISKETAMQEEGIEDVEAELAKIKAESYDVYSERVQQESDSIIKSANDEAKAMEEILEGLNLTQTPAELTEKEVERFKQTQG